MTIVYDGNIVRWYQTSFVQVSLILLLADVLAASDILERS